MRKSWARPGATERGGRWLGEFIGDLEMKLEDYDLELEGLHVSTMRWR